MAINENQVVFLKRRQSLILININIRFTLHKKVLLHIFIPFTILNFMTYPIILSLCYTRYLSSYTCRRQVLWIPKKFRWYITLINKQKKKLFVDAWSITFTFYKSQRSDCTSVSYSHRYSSNLMYDRVYILFYLCLLIQQILLKLKKVIHRTNAFISTYFTLSVVVSQVIICPTQNN